VYGTDTGEDFIEVWHGHQEGFSWQCGGQSLMFYICADAASPSRLVSFKPWDSWHDRLMPAESLKPALHLETAHLELRLADLQNQ